MTAAVADRVRDTTTSVGTGAKTLAGVPPGGYQSFLSAFPTGATDVMYMVADQNGGPNWEVGAGVYDGNVTLTPTTVLASSNGGAAVNFGVGTKDVFVSIPAERLLIKDANGNLVGIFLPREDLVANLLTTTGAGSGNSPIEIALATDAPAAVLLPNSGSAIPHALLTPWPSTTQITIDSNGATGGAGGAGTGTTTYTVTPSAARHLISNTTQTGGQATLLLTFAAPGGGTPMIGAEIEFVIAGNLGGFTVIKWVSAGGGPTYTLPTASPLVGRGMRMVWTGSLWVPSRQIFSEALLLSAIGEIGYSGGGAEAVFDGSIAFGPTATSAGVNAFAVGANSYALAPNANALGASSFAIGSSSLSVMGSKAGQNTGTLSGLAFVPLSATTGTLTVSNASLTGLYDTGNTLTLSYGSDWLVGTGGAAVSSTSGLSGATFDIPVTFAAEPGVPTAWPTVASSWTGSIVVYNNSIGALGFASGGKNTIPVQNYSEAVHNNRGLLNYFLRTTNATPVVVGLISTSTAVPGTNTNAAPGSSPRWIPPAGAYWCKVRAIAHQQGTTNVSTFERTFTVVSTGPTGGAAPTVSSLSTTGVTEATGVSGASIAIAASAVVTTAIDVTLTGIAGTVYWDVSIEYVYVT